MNFAPQVNSNAEKQFHYNLMRLCGTTEAIGVESIFEVISYSSQQGIIELYFVEEQYLIFFYNDDEFLTASNANICSFPQIVTMYEQAKRENKSEVLNLFRKIHREARKFLGTYEVKENLKCILAERKSRAEYQAYILMMQIILQYISEFANFRPHVTRLLRSVFPQIASEVDSDANLKGIDISKV